MSRNESQGEEQGFSLKSFFLPFTTIKAIHFIVIIGLIVFGNVLFNGFVWDDTVYLINNPDVHTLNIFYLFGPNSLNNGLYYRPFTALYFSLLYAIFHNTAFFYHLLQVSLHIVDSILFFVILKRFLQKKIAFFVSLVLLVHPIQVESAAFLSTTISPLSLFFGMIALILSFEKVITRTRLALLFFCLMTSLLIRETGVLFLAFVLLYRILFVFKKETIFLFFGVDALIVLLYAFLRFVVGGVHLATAKGTLVPIAGLTLFERFMNIPAIVFYYLKTFFFPATLAIDQQWVVTRLDFSSFYLPFMIDLFFLSVIIWLGMYLYRVKRKKFKIFLFFFLWFSLSLLFHLQLFPLDMTVADRFFYFPIIGLLGIIGVGGELLLPYFRKSTVRFAGYILAIVILVILSARTIVRNANWYDEMTLYTHDLKIYDSSNIENDLGTVYIARNNYHDALIHFKKSAEISPTEVNFYDVGFVYEKLGDLQKAMYYYQKGLTYAKYPPDQEVLIKASLSRRLAFVYLLLHEDQTARTFLKNQITKFPDQGYLWEYLAISEYRLQNQKEALFAIEKAQHYLSGNEVRTLYTEMTRKKPLQSLSQFSD